MLSQLQIFIRIHVDDDDGDDIVDEIRDDVVVVVILDVGSCCRLLGGDDAEEERLEDVAFRREGVPILVTAFQKFQYESRMAREKNRRRRTQILDSFEIIARRERNGRVVRLRDSMQKKNCP